MIIDESMKITGRIKVFSRKAGSNEPWKLESETKNLIMTAQNVGRDLLIQWLLGITTYPIGINWGAIGTGITTPTAGDTQLAAETNRTIPAFTEDYAFNEAVFQFFFPDSTLVNQIYYEFGTFVAGSNTANSGQIFNHALFTVPYSKSAGSDTTIEVDINIS